MSRYTKTLENGKTITYGFNPTLGYFLDVIGISNKGKAKILIEESSLHTKMSNAKMIELMTIYELPESQIDSVVMNLPIL